MPRVLDMVEPVLGLLPEVEKPKKQPEASDRILWSGLALFIFLVCCQVPVYGIKPKAGSDPFYWMRVILASNKGTLMELGISPIMTASLIMQLVQGVKLISMDDRNAKDRKLFAGGPQKAFGLLINFCRGFRLRAFRDVRGCAGDRDLHLPADCDAADFRRCDLHPARRAPPEGVRVRVWSHALHRHEHCEPSSGSPSRPSPSALGAGRSSRGPSSPCSTSILQSPNKVKGPQRRLLPPPPPQHHQPALDGLVFLVVIFSRDSLSPSAFSTSPRARRCRRRSSSSTPRTPPSSSRPPWCPTSTSSRRSCTSASPTTQW
eukprot:Sspe_Gene.26636::Locus_11174_Transcript_2_2_Confidence_0.667_Length_1635::g.26636::m.26636/K10956/SEC61A; protein transport protein SEC61 subunit alpha